MITKEKALSKTKIAMITEGSKFISSIAFSMKHIWEESIPTADVDGKVIRYNPDFFMSLNPDGRLFVMAHETWHVALNHLVRIGNKDPNIFKKAADYVINQLLVDAGFSMPRGEDGKAIGLQDNKYRGLSTNQVYDLLIQEENHEESIMEGDIRFIEDAPEEEKKEIEEYIKGIIVKAATRSKMSNEHGVIPEEIERLIDELINPKLPWERLVERFLWDTSKDDYTWKRPNRRFFPDFILPSLFSEALGHIAIAIDTSGSLSKKALTAILSEIQYIHQRFKPSKLTIMGCSYTLGKVYTLTPQDKVIDLEFKGGGGTRFQPVFDYLEEHPPKALIYFTDLYGPMIQQKPKYPVMWVCTSKHKPAEIGQTIYLKEG